jgi:TonB-dependent starch-binding outer membrane protein SusC
MNLSLAFTNTDAVDVNSEAVRYATIFNPTAPIRENTPEANSAFGGYFQRPLFDFFNPVALINQQRFTNEIKAALYSYRLEFDITDKITAATQFSQDRLNILRSSFFSRQDFATGFGRNGQAGQK